MLGSKGCGANMRVTPVGLLPDLDLDTLAGLSQLQAGLTHGHPTGLAASELTAYAVRILLDGVPLADVPAWLRDRATVVAAEPIESRCFNAALEAGAPVEVDVGGVAVSSLGSCVIGDYGWAARVWIDDSVLVSDEDIVAAQRWLWSETRLAVEPAAATTIAALRTGGYVPEKGSNVVAVLSGGNVDPGSVSEPPPADLGRGR